MHFDILSGNKSFLFPYVFIFIKLYFNVHLKDISIKLRQDIIRRKFISLLQIRKTFLIMLTAIYFTHLIRSFSGIYIKNSQLISILFVFSNNWYLRRSCLPLKERNLNLYILSMPIMYYIASLVFKLWLF